MTQSSAEQCPLGPGMHWEDDEDFSVCFRLCERQIETALMGPPVAEDSFIRSDEPEAQCMAETEHGGTSLQRGDGNTRFVGILDICTAHGEEVAANTYEFSCPYKA